MRIRFLRILNILKKSLLQRPFKIQILKICLAMLLLLKNTSQKKEKNQDNPFRLNKYRRNLNRKL